MAAHDGWTLPAGFKGLSTGRTGGEMQCTEASRFADDGKIATGALLSSLDRGNRHPSRSAIPGRSQTSPRQ